MTESSKGSFSFITVDEERFAYRLDREHDTAYLWRVADNFDSPFSHIEAIRRAAGQVTAETGAANILCCAAPSPESFDRTEDSERIQVFDRRVTEALTALGADPSEASEIFYYVGMPSDWRGAMWAAALIAERSPMPTKAHKEFMQRIAAICRFVAISMIATGSFNWCLAVGNRVLDEAVHRFRDGLRAELNTP